MATSITAAAAARKELGGSLNGGSLIGPDDPGYEEAREPSITR